MVYYFCKYNCVNYPKILTYSYFDRLFTKFVTKETLQSSFREPDDCCFGALLYCSHSYFVCVSIEAIGNLRALCSMTTIVSHEETQNKTIFFSYVVGRFTSFVEKVTKK